MTTTATMSGQASGAAASALTAARAHHAAQRFDEALAAYTHALQLDPGLAEARRGLVSILEMARTQRFHPRLAGLIAAALADPRTQHQALARAAAHQLRLKYGLTGAVDFAAPPGQALAAAVAQDELVLDLLRRTVNMDAVLERVLTALRRHLVLHDDGTVAIGLVAALAQQCLNNEHVFVAGPAENARVDAIAAGLASETTPSPSVERRVAICALYAPLIDLPCRDVLARVPRESWSAELRPVLASGLHDRLEEKSLAQTIPDFAPVDDDVSRIVRAQYEANPYPRWLQLPEWPRIDLIASLQSAYAHMAPPAGAGRTLRILSAGCGTGQHALSLASFYRDCHVTAFDLSRSSLAHAQRMATKLAIPNVEFFHGDILEVAQLGRDFDVVESIGVIHHMADPEAGWRSLLGVLAPGGLLRLGLSADVARREIVEARRRIAALGLDGSAPSIREFRRKLLDDPAYADLRDLTDWDDFFTVSAIRDLMFHVQEHRFTVARIRAMVEARSMRFIGFEFLSGFSRTHLPAGGAQARYRALFPGDASFADLARWEEVERRHPDTFAGYTFWCQKPVEKS
jgi:SAM-dependent methyltransferase